MKTYFILKFNSIASGQSSEELRQAHSQQTAIAIGIAESRKRPDDIIMVDQATYRHGKIDNVQPVASFRNGARL
jgi:hypothetical protein